MLFACAVAGTDAGADAVGTFLKSQRKRSPEFLDRKLLRLWCRWEDAFPGKGFNKFHGLFCTVRNFVHRYHMAGIVSEESNEAYNGTLATIKRPLCTMSSHTKRINKINERAQGNLKQKVMEQRLVIESATKKRKKRGTRVARAREHDGRAVEIGSDKLKVVDGDTYDWELNLPAYQARKQAHSIKRPQSSKQLCTLPPCVKGLSRSPFFVQWLMLFR